MSSRDFRVFGIVILLVTVCGLSNSVLADCKADTIHDLAKQGKTIKAIGSVCDMGGAEVKAVLEGDHDNYDHDDDVVQNNKLPSGVPSTPCGCFGPAVPGATFPDQNCQSGYAAATMCTAQCYPMGGFQWRGVCR